MAGSKALSSFNRAVNPFLKAKSEGGTKLSKAELVQAFAQADKKKWADEVTQRLVEVVWGGKSTFDANSANVTEDAKPLLAVLQKTFLDPSTPAPARNEYVRGSVYDHVEHLDKKSNLKGIVAEANKGKKRVSPEGEKLSPSELLQVYGTAVKNGLTFEERAKVSELTDSAMMGGAPNGGFSLKFTDVSESAQQLREALSEEFITMRMRTYPIPGPGSVPPRGGK